MTPFGSPEDGYRWPVYSSCLQNFTSLENTTTKVSDVIIWLNLFAPLMYRYKFLPPVTNLKMLFCKILFPWIILSWQKARIRFVKQWRGIQCRCHSYSWIPKRDDGYIEYLVHVATLFQKNDLVHQICHRYYMYYNYVHT